MKLIIMSLAMFLATTFCPEQPPVPPQKPARTITVRVDVKCGSDALEGVELSGKIVGMPDESIVHHTTLADGRAEFAFAGITTETAIEFWLSPGSMSLAPTAALMQAKQDAVKAHCRDYTFQREYKAAVPVSGNNADLVISVQRAVKATLRLKSGAAPLQNVSIMRGGACCASRTNEEGVATVGGLVPRAVNYIDACLVEKVQAGTEALGTQIARMFVPATAVDVDLGEIQVPTLNRNATATIGIKRSSDLLYPQVDRLNGFTLVSPSGQSILSFVGSMAERQEDGTVKFNSGDPVPKQVRIPAGTWYVAPGQFSWSSWQNRLIDRCMAGEDLTGTAIPRFTVVSGGAAVNVDVNAAAAERAILSLPLPPPP